MQGIYTSERAREIYEYNDVGQIDERGEAGEAALRATRVVLTDRKTFKLERKLRDEVATH